MIKKLIDYFFRSKIESRLDAIGTKQDDKKAFLFFIKNVDNLYGYQHVEMILWQALISGRIGYEETRALIYSLDKRVINEKGIKDLALVNGYVTWQELKENIR